MNGAIKEFFEQYYKVFNNSQSYDKAECKKLITIAKNLNIFIDFGDDTTGCMNIENIRILYKQLKDQYIEEDIHYE